MPRRQLLVFAIGCWSTLGLAALHLVAHVAGVHPPVAAMPAWVRELVVQAAFEVPGGTERTLLDVLDGFSLSWSVLLAAMGGVGLAVCRRGSQDSVLTYAVARVMAVGWALLLVLSLTYWGVPPSIFIALPAICFTLAAVRAPIEAS